MSMLHPSGAVVLAYHDILPDEHPPFWYAVSFSRFCLHLDLLERLRLTVVPLSEITSRHGNGMPLNGLATVMFDDAIVGVYDLAVAELAARGMRWTLAPVTDRLGVDPEWWPGSRRTMTRREIDEAVTAGAELAVHTETHRSLPSLDEEELRIEMARSRERLEDWTGAHVGNVIYPGGHHTARVRAMAEDVGFDAGYSFANGRIRHGIDRFMLPRLTMHEQMTTVPTLRSLLRPAFTWPALQANMVAPNA